MQTEALQQLYLNKSIHSFQHLKMQDIINNINDEQGRARESKDFRSQENMQALVLFLFAYLFFCSRLE